MAIVFTKLRDKLKADKKNLYSLRKDKVVGTATIEKLRHDSGYIDTRSIDSLCEYLNCQPGDIMEWIPNGNEKSNGFNAVRITSNI